MVEILLPLNDKQKTVLNFLIRFMNENLYPPTYNEIKVGTGLKHIGHVWKIVSSLERKEYVVRKKGERRCIRLAPITQRWQELKKG